MKARIIVTGLIGQHPLGGVTWDYVQYDGSGTARLRCLLHRGLGRLALRFGRRPIGR
jgi:hypothetical protein